VRNLEGWLFFLMVLAIVLTPFYLSSDKKTHELHVSDDRGSRYTAFTSLEACEKAKEQYREANRENYTERGAPKFWVTCKRVKQ
jgi:hypothetical protein